MLPRSIVATLPSSRNDSPFFFFFILTCRVPGLPFSAICRITLPPLFRFQLIIIRFPLGYFLSLSLSLYSYFIISSYFILSDMFGLSLRLSYEKSTEGIKMSRRALITTDVHTISVDNLVFKLLDLPPHVTSRLELQLF